MGTLSVQSEGKAPIYFSLPPEFRGDPVIFDVAIKEPIYLQEVTKESRVGSLGLLKGRTLVGNGSRPPTYRVLRELCLHVLAAPKDLTVVIGLVCQEQGQSALQVPRLGGITAVADKIITVTYASSLALVSAPSWSSSSRSLRGLMFRGSISNLAASIVVDRPLRSSSTTPLFSPASMLCCKGS